MATCGTAAMSDSPALGLLGLGQPGEWNAYVHDCDDVLSLAGIDLRKHCPNGQLNGFDFTSVDLEGVDAKSFRFDRATLTGANLRGAILDDASFVEADLCNADQTCLPGLGQERNLDEEPKETKTYEHLSNHTGFVDHPSRRLRKDLWYKSGLIYFIEGLATAGPSID